MAQSAIYRFASGAVLRVHPLTLEAWQALGAVMEHFGYHPRKEDTGALNCLAGDTQVVTDKGWFPIRDLVGAQTLLTAQVGLGGPGRWVEAEVRAFGEQKLWALTLERNGHVKVIHATREHRWFARSEGGAFRDVATSDLKPRSGRYGHRLAGTEPQSVISRVGLSPEGVGAGIVFGDGSLGEQGAVAYLCGAKDAVLDQWFHPSHKRFDYEGVTQIRGLPRSWKNVVPYDEGPGVLAGWLAGYFAADGRIGANGVCEINSAERWRLEAAKVAALRLGVASSPITSVMRKGYGDGPSELFSLRLDPRALDAEFFLIPHHRERWRRPEKAWPDWSVVSVRETDRSEMVYCAVVPGTESFVIEDFILTGNCRPITGGTKLSLHAFGIAADISWRTNPYGRVLITDMPRAMVEAIEAIRTKSGHRVFRWGGDWNDNNVQDDKPYDAMHFEIVASKTEMSSGIDWGTVAGGQPVGPAPSPVPTPPPPYPTTGATVSVTVELPVLAIGDKGDAVRQLQALLAAGGAAIVVDGGFGPATQNAVKQVQMFHGLTVDGIVGGQTWRALMPISLPIIK